MALSKVADNGKIKALEGWDNARLWVENMPDGRLVPNEETVNLLVKIKKRLKIVSAVGSYRTGKSYLLKLLTDSKADFKVGHTSERQTSGIWISCLEVSHDPNSVYILVDVEGLGDTQKADSQNDAKLFLFACIISSKVIYNSKGTINNETIESMKFIIEMSTKFKVSISDAQSNTDVATHFPSLVWIVRDFAVDLIVNGKPASENEYLDHALKVSKQTQTNHQDFSVGDLCRQSIIKFFATRECIIFPTPVTDNRKLKQLDSIPVCDLFDEFLMKVKQLSDDIYHNTSDKHFNGIPLEGSALSEVVDKIADTLSNNKEFVVEDATTAIVFSVNTKAVYSAVKSYEEYMAKVPLPTPDNCTIEEHHKKGIEQAYGLFGEQSISVGDMDQFQKMLEKHIEQHFEKIVLENAKISETQCQKYLDKHAKHFETKVSQNSYNKAGGYEEFSNDKRKVQEGYESEENLSVQKSVVLQRWKTKYEEQGKVVMLADKMISETEKIEIERKKDQGKAEQREKQFQEKLEEECRQKIIREENYKRLEEQLQEQKQLIEENKRNRKEEIEEADRKSVV